MRKTTRRRGEAGTSVNGRDKSCDREKEHSNLTDLFPAHLERRLQAVLAGLTADPLTGRIVVDPPAAVVVFEAGASCSRHGRSLGDALPQLRCLLTKLLHRERATQPHHVAEVVERLSQAFFRGYHQHAANRAGKELATTFAVMVPPPAQDARITGGAAEKVLRIDPLQPGRLLIAAKPEEAKHLLAELHPGLRDEHWTGIAASRSPNRRLPLEQARRIALITRALDCPPGIYERQHVLLELLAVQDAETERSLASVVSRVMQNDTLTHTLKVLFHTNGNRNEAARRLFVHRSTLDYRMTRISQLTGWDPSDSRELMLFRAGFAAVAVDEERHRGLNIA
ncbi:PucR family transcriptional regulator [Lentzea sp. NPDC102401]|uniref:PucR family transcriptional regulator n=1 Tax=Lentzea sp. NPDC102401 TaxID=3364128 RepID=UPI0037FBEA6D